MRRERLHVRVLGLVQGVGFRPFVHRLAGELGLAGWVRNDGDGVVLEVEGAPERLPVFLERLQGDRPTASFLAAVESRFVEPEGEGAFAILESGPRGRPRAWILPDLATCAECAADVRDPANRRHRYPFTNCTHCGPRFTIIDDLPYDRARTSMRGFPMCEECRREYEDPADRRFHAQPNACPRCGPRLSFFAEGRPAEDREPAAEGEGTAEGEEALRRAVEAVRRGRILALKGLGGYHIMADARHEETVAELRRRKRRPTKAFAVMMPDVESLRRHVEVPAYALPLLVSPQAPILLLPRTEAGWREIAPSVAPDSPSLGVFLPYTPLHALLLDELGFPVVATSGNRTDQPTLHLDEEARRDLSGLCDAFLVHDRPIRRQADDSVVHVLTRPRPRPQSLRRARGYAPLPLLAPRDLPDVLALGGQKNAVFAFARGREVILSQHLGDLEGWEGRESFERTLAELLRLFDVRPSLVAHDLHPDYFTTALAERMELPRVAVQHHHAHLAACLLENRVEGPALGITWDGTGWGPDHTVWGGEFLLGDARGFRRVATLHPFRLPGGEAAVRETWRVALALLHECYGEEIPRDLPPFGATAGENVELVLAMIERGLHAPVTTSVGRLCDGVSALLGLSFVNTHQAQSPQLLEYAAWRHGAPAEPLPVPLVDGDPIRVDWRPAVRALADRVRAGRPVEESAAAFHRGLAEAAVAVAKRVGETRVAMAGGVFCNRYLGEELLVRLEEEGFTANVHSQLPPTDGSLAAGQLWVAAHAEGAGAA